MKPIIHTLALGLACLAGITNSVPASASTITVPLFPISKANHRVHYVNGRFYVIGGGGDGALEAWSWAPSETKWTRCTHLREFGSMTTYSQDGDSIVGCDGKIYCFGDNISDAWVGTVEYFDPTGNSGDGSWSQAPTWTVWLPPDGQISRYPRTDITRKGAVPALFGEPNSWHFVLFSSTMMNQAVEYLSLISWYPDGLSSYPDGLGFGQGDKIYGGWVGTNTGCHFPIITGGTSPNDAFLLVGGSYGAMDAQAGMHPLHFPYSFSSTVTNAYSFSSTATRMNDGNWLLAGGHLRGVGYDLPNDTAQTSNAWSVMTPDAQELYGSWSSPTASMPRLRELHSAALCGDGTVIVAGGRDGSTGTSLTLQTADIFDPITKTWSPAPDLPKPIYTDVNGTPIQNPDGTIKTGPDGARFHFAVFVVNGYPVFSGGASDDPINTMLKDCVVWDYVNKQWTDKIPAVTITTIHDQTTQEDTPITIPFSIGDLKTPSATLSLVATTDNTSLLPLSWVVFGGSGANRTVTIKPGTNQTGTCKFRVRVNSTPDLETNSTLFNVTVLPVNDLPTITPACFPDQVIPVGGSVTLPFAVGDVETPAASLTMSATIDTPAVVPVSAVVFGGSGANRTVTITPTSLVPGQSGRVRLWVTDSDSGKGYSCSFKITVNNNLPTIAPAVFPDQVVAVGGSVTLPFTVGDVETPAASLTMSATIDTPTVVPVSAVVFGGTGANRTVTITPTSLVPGQSGRVRLWVTDTDSGKGYSSSFNVTMQ